jgi:hypothetical protein
MKHAIHFVKSNVVRVANVPYLKPRQLKKSISLKFVKIDASLFAFLIYIHKKLNLDIHGLCDEREEREREIEINKSCSANTIQKARLRINIT